MILSKTSHLEYIVLQLEYFIYMCYISYIYWLLLLLFLDIYIYVCETIYIYILIWNICSKVNTIYIIIFKYHYNIYIYIYIHRYLVANNAGTFILIVGSQQCWRANNIIYLIVCYRIVKTYSNCNVSKQFEYRNQITKNQQNSFKFLKIP